MRSNGPLAVLARVLANASLRRILVAYLAFNVAEFATWVAVLLYAYERTGPASVGVVALLQLVPAALIAAPVATLGDRFRRERVLTAGYAVQAAAMLATAAAMAAALPIGIVYATAAVAASSLVVTRPTQSALLPSLSRTPDELTAANSAVGMAEGVGVLVGPLIAAAVLTGASVAVVFVIAGVALTVSARATIRLWDGGGLTTVQPRAPTSSTTDRDMEDARDTSFSAGLRTIGRDPDARLVVGLLTTRMLVIGSADVLFVLLALELLDMGEPGAGLLNAAMGGGIILGGAIAYALIGRSGLAVVAAVGALAWGGAIALVGITATAAAAPGLIIIGGAGLTIVDVAGRTILQRSVRDEVLARVFGLQEGLAMAGLALGSVLVSILSVLIGLVATIAVIAAILPAVVLLTWPQLSALDRRAMVPVRALALLRRTTLFSPLPGPQLEGVARRGVWVTVPPATIIIQEGDSGDRYYVISDGAVRVEQGGRHLRDLASPGDGFGEIALLRDVPRTATVTSIRETVLFAVDRGPFLAAVTGHPDAYRAAHEVVAGQGM